MWVTEVTLNDWRINMSYVYGEEFEKKTSRGKRVRSIQEINHHGGSRLWARYIEEQIAKTGVKPSRGQLYIKFYKLDKGDEKDRKLAVYSSMRGHCDLSYSCATSISSATPSSPPPSRLEFNKLLETVQQLVTHMASSQGLVTQPPAHHQMPPNIPPDATTSIPPYAPTSIPTNAPTSIPDDASIVPLSTTWVYDVIASLRASTDSTLDATPDPHVATTYV
ncbi:hypothetical protein LINPERPRIM_LOCUS31569 [Linum perenne]